MYGKDLLRIAVGVSFLGSILQVKLDAFQRRRPPPRFRQTSRQELALQVHHVMGFRELSEDKVKVQPSYQKNE